ncbi:MAG: HAD-IA family hydrolase [Pseudomonadota bacterium]
MAYRPTVVFDLDGTLADSVHDLLSALNRTLARHDLPQFAPQDFVELSPHGGVRGMLKHAFDTARVPLSEQKHDVLFAETVRDYDDNIAVHTKLYPGVLPCLNTFEREGWIMAVCTNKPYRQARKLLHELDVAAKFSAITGGDSFTVKKPDPQHLIQTVDQAGGRPERCVMVGDSKVDIQTAQRAKVPAIALDFGYSNVPVQQLFPDAVVSHFEDVFERAIDVLKTKER